MTQRKILCGFAAAMHSLSVLGVIDEGLLQFMEPSAMPKEMVDATKQVRADLKRTALAALAIADEARKLAERYPE